jgi:hypothetical protein
MVENRTPRRMRKRRSWSCGRRGRGTTKGRPGTTRMRWWG